MGRKELEPERYQGATVPTKKERHTHANRTHARAFLKGINAEVGQDFHALKTSQVDAVIEEADRVRYQRPKNANGSRARYFYERMQRQAQAKD